MRNLFLRLVKLFTNYFKIIGENEQLYVIKSVDKTEQGHNLLCITSINSGDLHFFYPHQILDNKTFRNQIRKTDVKIVESMIFCEGDIFVLAKEYQGENIAYCLKSYLTKEEWKLTESQISQRKDILNRLNIRYFDKSVNFNFLNLKQG